MIARLSMDSILHKLLSSTVMLIVIPISLISIDTKTRLIHTNSHLLGTVVKDA